VFGPYQAIIISFLVGGIMSKDFRLVYLNFLSPGAKYKVRNGRLMFYSYVGLVSSSSDNTIANWWHNE
jgi:hypothetical protein